MSIHLIKTPAGWAYPDLGPRACGETDAMRGFQFCRCAGTEGGSGHPQWRCKACDRVRTWGASARIRC